MALDKRLFTSLEEEGPFVHWLRNGQEEAARSS